MGRPRRKDRADWPKGLHQSTVKGVIYYSYLDPRSGTKIGLGGDLEAAKEAVRSVARERAPEPVQALIARIEAPRCLVTDYIDWFKDRHLPERRMPSGAPLSAGSLQNWGWFLERVRKAWGSRDLAKIETLDISLFLDPIPPSTANKYRGFMVDFFQHACSRGHRKDNPAMVTTRKDEVFLRLRLEEDAYRKIHAAAAPWLQRAMTLSLLSGQREGDLCDMLLDCWDGQWWSVRQSKGEGLGENLFRFRPHDELRAALDACAAARIGDCPYLLCRPPERMSPQRRKTGMHWAKVVEENLSRDFADVRDELRLFETIPEGKLPPSYYEIKALGLKLDEDAGRPIEWIQAKAGHRDKETTQIYLDRHKQKWTQIDLSLSGVSSDAIRKRVTA